MSSGRISKGSHSSPVTDDFQKSGSRPDKSVGEFRGNRQNREVTHKNLPPYLPDDTSRAQAKTRDQWDIKIVEPEHNLTTDLAGFQTARTPDDYKDIEKAVKRLTDQFFQLMSQYTQRINSLKEHGRIDFSRSERIKSSLSRDAQGSLDKINDLKKKLDPKKAKKEKKTTDDVLAQIREEMTTCQKFFHQARESLKNATQPPPVQPHVASGSKAVRNRPLPPLENLEKLTVDISHSRGQKDLQATISKAAISSGQLLDQTNQLLNNNPRVNEKNLSSFSQARSLIERSHRELQDYHIQSKTKSADLAEIADLAKSRMEMISVTFTEINKLLEQSSEAAPSQQKPAQQPEKSKQTRVKASPAESPNLLIASQLKSAELRQTVEKLNSASSGASKAEALSEIQSMVTARQQELGQLPDLLNTLALKCQFEGQQPVEESVVLSRALKQLELGQAALPTQTRSTPQQLSRDLIQAIKQLDESFDTLAQLKGRIPAAITRQLTDIPTGKAGSGTLMVSLLLRSSLKMKGDVNDSLIPSDQLDMVNNYLATRNVHGNLEETKQANQTLQDSVFASPERFRTLLHQVRNFDELAQLREEFTQWSIPHLDQLTKTSEQLKQAKADLDFPDFHPGKQALEFLLHDFPTSITNAKRTAFREHKTSNPQTLTTQLNAKTIEFAKKFEEFNKALMIATKHGHTIKKHHEARVQLTELGEQLKDALPPRKQTRRKRIKRQTSLEKLRQQSADITSRPLKTASNSLSEHQQQIVRDIMRGKVSVSDGVKVMKLLLKMKKVSEKPGWKVPEQETGEHSKPPVELTLALDKLDRQLLLPKFFYRSIRNKKYRLLVETRKLVEICRNCPATPEYTARLLNEHLDSLEKSKKKHSKPVNDIVSSIESYSQKLSNAAAAAA